MPVESSGLEEPPEIPRCYDQTEWEQDLGDEKLLYIALYQCARSGKRDIFSVAFDFSRVFAYNGRNIRCTVKEDIMGWRFTVEIVAVLIMLGGVGGIFYGVFKGTIALSVRTLQFLAITFVVPAVLILSLERSLGNESTAALLGTIVGYVLAGGVKSE